MPTEIPSAPTTVKMKYFDFNSNTIGGVSVYTFFVRCRDLYPMPLEANVRLPSDTAAAYVNMRETLSLEPAIFFFKNGGINVIASSVKVIKDSKKFELVFDHNYGVLNGGHTQQAIVDQNDEYPVEESAFVRIEVLEWKGQSNQQLASLAAAKNLSTNVKITSIANKNGYFDPLKKEMDHIYEKNIQWFENEETEGDRFSATDLIAILNLFDLTNYSMSDHPLASANAPGNVMKSWIKSCSDGNPKLLQVFPLVNDILDLYEYILSTFNTGIPRGFTGRKQVKNVQEKNKSTPFTKQPLDFTLPKQVLMPVLASFRADLELYDGKYRWIIDPKVLFDRVKYDLFKNVGDFMDRNDINRLSKDPTIWTNLYMRVQIAVNSKV